MGNIDSSLAPSPSGECAPPYGIETDGTGTVDNVWTIRAALNRALEITAKEPLGPSNELISAALAALGRIADDSARLDWIENEVAEYRYHADFAIQQDEEDGVWFTRFSRHDTGELGQGLAYEDGHAETVREAIDAARAAGLRRGPAARR